MAEKKTIILQLLKILQEETDRNHILNAQQLSERLECNRKTIYANIEMLRSMDVAIEQVKGSNPGYYISEREFSLPELKLLVDAVQASKFITSDQSDELIRKLEQQTTKDQARSLRRQVFIYNRAKTGNAAVYQNVDVIHSAMQENSRIQFHYCEWTVRKELVPRHDGALYDVSPWSLAWDDENYYLVGFDEKDQKIKHYRVDKMQDMKLSHKERNGREQFDHFDLASYAKKTFGMYGGEDVNITLSGDKRLVGVVIDRFGTDIMLRPDLDTPDRFVAHVLVSVSPQFFGWLAGIGPGLRIDKPERVRDAFKAHLDRIRDQY